MRLLGFVDPREKKPDMIPKEKFTNLLESGVIKFETLEFFQKKNMLSAESFQLWKTFLQKNIVAQCRDARFDDFAMKEIYAGDSPELRHLFNSIHENDLKNYVAKGYIDQKTALECYKALPSNRRNSVKK